MANTTQEDFGGPWTQEKLLRLQKYLAAYTRIFKKNPRARFFQISYVDAFAGTGYLRAPEAPLASLFPDELRPATEYTKGSAVRALEVDPAFDNYLFVESDEERFQELQALKSQFPSRKITLLRGDANEQLKNWCLTTDWSKNRAVVFLDPFGMQVEWPLIDTIAKTQAIDLWLLFPLFATIRLLVTHGKPPQNWGHRLTRTFGTAQWEHEFYRTEKSQLIEGVERTFREADTKRIEEFFIERLKAVFAGVAEPLVLKNTRGSPLFLLCFAAGNPKGAPTAVKIARAIIEG